MKKLMSFVCAALFAFSFCAVMPSNAFSADPNRQEVEKRFELNSATAEELAGTGAVSLEVAKKIVELRDQLGSFQSYDDLNELELPKESDGQAALEHHHSGHRQATATARACDL